MILTKEELKVLVHDYSVKAACAEAQGLIDESCQLKKCADNLVLAHKNDIANILSLDAS